MPVGFPAGTGSVNRRKERNMRFEVGTLASRVVVTATPEMPITEAARLMRQHHVGALVVRAGQPDGARPIGLVTDRDLVVEVLAQDVDPRLVTVGDVMSGSPVTAGERDSLFDAIDTMRRRGVRRLIVVGEAGQLVGLLSLDDVMAVLAEEMTGVAKAIDGEIRAERRQRPLPVRSP
jgi:CBS domain-containing protein